MSLFIRPVNRMHLTQMLSMTLLMVVPKRSIQTKMAKIIFIILGLVKGELINNSVG